MCQCTSQHHGLLHWKYVLRCWEKVPGISIPHQEKNKYATNTCTTIRFHDYRNVSRVVLFMAYSHMKNIEFFMCCTDISSLTPGKVNTRKELVLLEYLRS